MLELKLENLAQRGINPFCASLMAAMEARYINEQVHLGILELDKKPSTLALEKLLDGRVVAINEEETEA